MDESKYTTYDHYTSNNQDNIINSLNAKEMDYNIFNDEHISHNRKNVSKPNIRLRNKYPKR